jgi:FkbM family methyltransferase
LGVRRDAATGQLFYDVEGVRHFVRFRHEAVRKRWREAAFERMFTAYLPRGTECVVDIGAGLGTEIISLARLSPDLRYIAVEIQPWVYECLCLTLDQLPRGFTPVGMAIAPEPSVAITPTFQGEDANVLGGGPVHVAAISWGEFLRRHRIRTVDLLKMNVEGAEAALLDHIDLGCVGRVLVQVHDFRAQWEGDHFRTRDRVMTRLTSAGFAVTELSGHWIFAERAG